MREFLQTVIPVVLTALIAGQVAITRTGRLRKDIRETIELLASSRLAIRAGRRWRTTSGSWSTRWSGASGDGLSPSRGPGPGSVSTSPSPC